MICIMNLRSYLEIFLNKWEEDYYDPDSISIRIGMRGNLVGMFNAKLPHYQSNYLTIHRCSESSIPKFDKDFILGIFDKIDLGKYKFVIKKRMFGEFDLIFDELQIGDFIDEIISAFDEVISLFEVGLRYGYNSKCRKVMIWV